ncbi:hypothetical protein CYMTET_19418 [Cymbomonas tetramitiformis]|uniref:FYVE-type domain-containing protein n=1 Tax=Cymbomonas tetramitiformis TaxID=36881 RepID=A0AAE0G6M1_9CHLO|nr:hypothetical protein CYMTET_19418 [Cymbomonas tetramitiformis]
MTDFFDRFKKIFGKEKEPEGETFWISDESCKVCYDCEETFNVFFRRHHCRVCGKVFCNKCSLNTLPAPNKISETVRVCNYCFSLHKKGTTHQTPTNFSRPTAVGTKPAPQPDGLRVRTTTERVEEDERGEIGSKISPCNQDVPEDPKPREPEDHENQEKAADTALVGGEDLSYTGSPMAEADESPHDEGHAAEEPEMPCLTAPSTARRVLWDETTRAGRAAGPAALLDNDLSLWLPPPKLPDRQESTAPVEQGGGKDASAGAELDGAHLRSVYYEGFQRIALRHLEKIVLQLLQLEDLSDAANLHPIIIKLARAAAESIHLQEQVPDGETKPMDVRHYVKVKRVVHGKLDESRLVPGIVCRKNVVHRHMASSHEAPRIVLLLGALEYQRVENRLSSLDTLLEQEREHLRVAVARIAVHRPDVLLVEKTVSRYAQELLLWENISVVLNVKTEVMLRVSRCTGAQMAASTEQLTEGSVGQCDSFYVKSFRNAQGGGSKTLMFFDGCPLQLGCTVLLHGDSKDTLTRMKRVLQFAVFAAYHQRLESALLADESVAVASAHFSGRTAAAAAAAAAQSELAWVEDKVMPAISMSPHVRLWSGDVRELCEMEKPQADEAVGSPRTMERQLNVSMATPLLLEQRLNVSVSSHCPVHGGGEMCEVPAIRCIANYRGNDVQLSEFLLAALPGPLKKCTDPHCAEGPAAHVRTYIHQRSKLTLLVHNLQGSLDSDVGSKEGDAVRDGQLWHWSRCLVCMRQAAEGDEVAQQAEKARRRVRLSTPVSSMSFGKFLELGFSAEELTAPCGHRLHEDHIRFFGCHEGVAALCFEPIQPNSIVFPAKSVAYVSRCQGQWLHVEVAELHAIAGTASTQLSFALAAFQDFERHFQAGSPNLAADAEPQIRDVWSQLEAESKRLRAGLAAVVEGCNHDIGTWDVGSGPCRTVKDSGGVPMMDILGIHAVRRELHELIQSCSANIQEVAANMDRWQGRGGDLPAPIASERSMPPRLGRDIGKEMAKEIGKELGKEIGKETAKEIGKELGKEIGKEMAKEIGKELGKELGSEVSPPPRCQLLAEETTGPVAQGPIAHGLATPPRPPRPSPAAAQAQGEPLGEAPEVAQADAEGDSADSCKSPEDNDGAVSTEKTDVVTRKRASTVTEEGALPLWPRNARGRPVSGDKSLDTFEVQQSKPPGTRLRRSSSESTFHRRSCSEPLLDVASLQPSKLKSGAPQSNSAKTPAVGITTPAKPASTSRWHAPRPP